MQTPVKKQILEFHHNTIDEVRKLYGLDKPGEMENALDILEDWVKKQHHFIKKNFSRCYLETTLILCKGSIERAKRRLDRGCTFKTMMPHFFGNFNIRNDFKEFDGIMNFTVFPKLTEGNQRAVLIRYHGKNPSSTFVVQASRICFMVCEFLLLYPDYVSGYILIFDILEASLSSIINAINVAELREAASIYVDGYGIRLKALHLLSRSKLTNIILKIIKQVREKLVSRVHFHQSIETLHDFLPKDLLPKDYGGSLSTLAELHEDWLEALSTEEFRSYLSEVSAAGTDESLRDTATFNEQYMGMAGTFRFLNVD